MKKGTILRLLWVTLPLLALTPMGCGITAHNTALIRKHRNPETEFRLYDKSHGIPYTERTLTASLTRTNESYHLRIRDLLYKNMILELTFPVRPMSRNSSELQAEIVPKTEADVSDANTVSVEIIAGKYDSSIMIDNKMTWSGTMPNRLTFGVYWNLFTHDCNYIEYTVGYRYDETNRFTTVHCTNSLPWNNRSHLYIAGLYACYLWTVPCDIITSPFQALVYLITPNWHD